MRKTVLGCSIALGAVLICSGVGWIVAGTRVKANPSANERTFTVERGEVSVEVSESGAVEPVRCGLRVFYRLQVVWRECRQARVQGTHAFGRLPCAVCQKPLPAHSESVPRVGYTLGRGRRCEKPFWDVA